MSLPTIFRVLDNGDVCAVAVGGGNVQLFTRGFVPSLDVVETYGKSLASWADDPGGPVPAGWHRV